MRPGSERQHASRQHGPWHWAVAGQIRAGLPLFVPLSQALSSLEVPTPSRDTSLSFFLEPVLKAGLVVAASALILVRGWVISRDYRPCQYSKHSSCWKAGSPHQNRARHMLTHVPRHWGHRLPLMCVHTPIFSCSHMYIPARAHSHAHAHSNEHLPCSGPGFSVMLCVHTLCCVHPTRESSLCHTHTHTQSIPSPIPIASDGSDNRGRDNGDNGAL